MRRCHHGVVVEAEGRGDGRMRRERPAAARGREGAALEVGDAPDRWVPPVSERERERRGGGRCGPAWAERWLGRWWVG
jgi:hypothetical protein